MRLPPATILGIALVLLVALLGPASASHSIADGVKASPAADTIRESLRCFERGEASDDDAVKLQWYSRGKTLAEAAIRQNDRDADAHFALFANWGRWLQTDGWLKSALHLPALQRELDRALEIDPNHTGALSAKGGLYLQLPGFLGGDPSKARPLLERAIQLDPEAVGARLELADYYLLENQRDRARELAAEALTLATAQGKERFARRASKLLEEVGPPPAQAHARRI
jgi:tetratricopeptide (TPR) repeat protein